MPTTLRNARRAFGTVATAAVVAALAMPTPPAAAGAQGSVQALAGRGTVQVLAPRSGAVITTPNAAAARAVRLTAVVRVRGPVRQLTVLLNGHRFTRAAARAGTQRLRLDAADGLSVGQNLLWVSASFRGTSRPRVVPVRFLVGYRAAGLLTSELQLGRGSGPAAAVTLQAPLTGVDRFDAALNGRRLALPAATPERGGHRLLALDLAQLGPLLAGRNRLRLRLIMTDGRTQETTHTVTLSRFRDIAVARAAGAATVGRRTVVDALRSRLTGGHHLGDARWVLLHRPANSRARLARVAGVRTALRPDVPGHYLIGLHVGNGYDVLDLAATYPDPLVALNTIVYAANTSPPIPGIQVGGSLYLSSYQAVQVLVLDRRTLGLVDNRGYSTNQFDALGDYLKNLPATDLVIVTHPGNQAALPSDTLGPLDTDLASIGGNLAAQWRFGTSACWSGATNYCENSSATWQRSGLYDGSFTVVGVPGLSRGQAWRETAAQNHSTDGRIVGYLTLGVATDNGAADEYTVVPGPAPYQSVNTCTAGGCAVSVGSQTYSPAAGVNGFHVVVLDRTTLAPIANRTVTTVVDLETALTGTGPTVGHFYIQPLFDDQRLVIIQSVGTGQLSGNPSSQLLEQVDQLGGTPEFLLASLHGGRRYALVGAATNLPWHGTAAMESSTAMVTGSGAGQPTGTVSGELQRDRAGLYAPGGGDPVGPTNTDLYRILYQPAVAWPFAGDPALPYIATGIYLSATPDVRSAYENLNLDFGSKAVLLSGLTCVGEPFCGTDFDAVKGQLLREFDWVQSVRALALNLSAPYVQNGSGTYFDVQQITSEILAGLPVPADKTADMRWLTIMTGVMGIASKAAGAAGPEASAVFGVIGAAGSLATSLMQTPGGGPADAVKTAANQLAAQMDDQQKAYLEWVYRMETILLADSGRLSAVGTAVGSDLSWAWQPGTTIDAITALDGGTRAAAYTALVPVAWGGYNLKPGANLTASNDVTSYICDEPANYPAHRTPFAGAPTENQFQAATSFSGSGTQTNQVWTFANLDPPWGTFNDAWASLPSTSITDKIYGKQSTGPDGAYQYGPSWWRATYNPPGHVTCQRGESSMDVNQVWSQHYPPPQIPQPLP